MAVSAKKRASNARWDAKNIKRMSLVLRNELHENVVEYAKAHGETVNGFITRVLREYLEKTNNDKGE